MPIKTDVKARINIRLPWALIQWTKKYAVAKNTTFTGVIRTQLEALQKSVEVPNGIDQY